MRNWNTARRAHLFGTISLVQVRGESHEGLTHAAGQVGTADFDSGAEDEPLTDGGEASFWRKVQQDTAAGCDAPHLEAGALNLENFKQVDPAERMQK